MKKVTFTPRKNSVLEESLIALKVGFFLAIRQIKGSGKWTNALVVAVMVLTFLNLVVVSGILVGLIEGAGRAVQGHYLGDIFISALDRRSFIERTPIVLSAIKNQPEVSAFSPRYIIGGVIDENFQTLAKPGENRKTVSTSFAGINPKMENETSGLEKKIVEGEYLEENDYGEVLLGALLLKKYLDFESPSFPILSHTTVGSKIRVTVNGIQKDVTVKGIVRSKVDEIDRRVFMNDLELRALAGRYDYNVGEIAVKISPDVSPLDLKNRLIGLGIGQYGRVQTAEDAEPKFIKDIKKTFAILGNVISSIGLVVATITIFIVIFINAITRRKYIGILKGIGVNAQAIEAAYVFQAIFYAILGATLGVALVFFVLKPYLDAHPINFPFSDGILVATPMGISIRVLILLAATTLAGYVPARIVTKQNTLDAILNR